MLTQFRGVLALAGVVGLLVLVAGNRRPVEVNDFSFRRAVKMHVEVKGCSGQTCVLSNGSETRQVISPESYPPGEGLATLTNQAGTLNLINFVPYKPAASLGIVEEVRFIEKMRLVTIQGVTYTSESCQPGQMASQTSANEVTCSSARR